MYAYFQIGTVFEKSPIRVSFGSLTTQHFVDSILNEFLSFWCIHLFSFVQTGKLRNYEKNNVLVQYHSVKKCRHLIQSQNSQKKINF